MPMGAPFLGLLECLVLALDNFTYPGCRVLVPRPMHPKLFPGRSPGTRLQGDCLALIFLNPLLVLLRSRAVPTLCTQDRCRVSPEATLYRTLASGPSLTWDPVPSKRIL